MINLLAGASVENLYAYITTGIVGMWFVGYGLFWLGSRYIANTFLKPGHQPLVKTPRDYGLNYEDVTVTTEDGVNLAAWLIRGTNDKFIIMGHPGRFTKYGFSVGHEAFIKSGFDRDVEFIPGVKHLVNAGYTVLMYDQRNHGESSDTPDNRPHDLPANVYLDTLAVVKYASTHADFEHMDIGLYGICQNSMINMIALSNAKQQLLDAKVRAMTIIQPHGIERFYDRFGVPKAIVSKANEFYIKANATPMSGWNPVNFAGDITIPTLFVQNVNDPWTDMNHVKDIYNRIPAEKEALWIDEKETHRFIAYNWFNDHPEQLVNFFDEKLCNR